MDYIKWLVMPFLIVFAGIILLLCIDLIFECFTPPGAGFEEN